jgi:hypothetical protein
MIIFYNFNSLGNAPPWIRCKAVNYANKKDLPKRLTEYESSFVSAVAGLNLMRDWRSVLLVGIG